MASQVVGKKILIIGPIFFGYTKEISNQLTRLGATVHLHSDKPSESFFTKAAIRINRKILFWKTNKYYDDIVESYELNYFDYILVIRGEAISSKRINKLKAKHSNAHVVLYLWDSMFYNRNAINIMHEFDKVYSFDMIDTQRFSCIEFLPLFYTHHYAGVEPYHSSDFNYDICFVGTVHTDRYVFLEKLVDYCELKSIKIHLFCFYPSRMLCFLRGMLDVKFKRFAKKYIHFHPISPVEIINIFKQTKCVLDINRPKQQGLTIRSIETLASNRKLITTNSEVCTHELFTENNVLVVTRDNPVISKYFLDKDLTSCADTEIYSISSWIGRVFNK